jgi:hypothetical protein
MAKADHPEKYNWWLNELDSLGINTIQEKRTGEPIKKLLI